MTTTLTKTRTIPTPMSVTTLTSIEASTKITVSYPAYGRVTRLAIHCSRSLPVVLDMTPEDAGAAARDLINVARAASDGVHGAGFRANDDASVLLLETTADGKVSVKVTGSLGGRLHFHLSPARTAALAGLILTAAPGPVEVDEDTAEVAARCMRHIAHAAMDAGQVVKAMQWTERAERLHPTTPIPVAEGSEALAVVVATNPLPQKTAPAAETETKAQAVVVEQGALF